MNYGKEFLALGIRILARAHEVDYFVDGHRGGAVIAAYYLLRDNPQLTSANEFIAEHVNQLWNSKFKFRPFPEEEADPSLVLKLTEIMEDNLYGLRQAGHNVILPTLALKAFQDRPDLITPSRIFGICSMVEDFTTQATELTTPVSDFPDFEDQTAAAEFILREYIACTERFLGRGQGWSGHLLTYGMALFDLRDLGYLDLARKAEPGFRLYIDRIRQGPQEYDIPRPEHQPLTHTPLDNEYWPDHPGDWSLGHILKYPYAFYNLLTHVRDESLRDEVVQTAFRVL